MAIDLNCDMGEGAGEDEGKDERAHPPECTEWAAEKSKAEAACCATPAFSSVGTPGFEPGTPAV